MNRTYLKLTIFLVIVLLTILAAKPAAAKEDIAKIIADLDFSPGFIHYLTPEHNKLLQSSQCADHIPTKPDEVEIMNQAYTLLWCASYVRLIDADYKRGWELFKMASVHLEQIPCDCELHNHADQMGYGTYLEVKGVLDSNGNITDTIINYCANVTTEYDPVVEGVTE